MDNEGNNSLYFIVGGLVVLAAVFGFIYMANDGSIGDDFGNITPAAGESTFNDNDTSETRTELEIDEDGVSSSTTRSE